MCTYFVVYCLFLFWQSPYGVGLCCYQKRFSFSLLRFSFLIRVKFSQVRFRLFVPWNIYTVVFLLIFVFWLFWCFRSLKLVFPAHFYMSSFCRCIDTLTLSWMLASPLPPSATSLECRALCMVIIIIIIIIIINFSSSFHTMTVSFIFDSLLKSLARSWYLFSFHMSMAHFSTPNSIHISYIYSMYILIACIRVSNSFLFLKNSLMSSMYIRWLIFLLFTKIVFACAFPMNVIQWHHRY